MWCLQVCWGSGFLFSANRSLLEGGTVSEHLSASRTVFTPKASDIDDNGRVVGSPDALRPLTLCNFFFTNFTLLLSGEASIGNTMRCVHPSQRCISSKHMEDNKFEIETTALAHVVCTPQESGVLPTDFAAAYPSVNHSSILEKTENDSTSHVEFAGATSGQFLVARGVKQGCPARCFCLLWPLTRSSDASKRQLSQGTLTAWISCSLSNVLTLTTSLLQPRPFGAY